MSRKDYELIARVLQSQWEIAGKMTGTVTLSYVIGAFMDALAEDNPRFDKAKFIEAAALNP